MQSSLNCEKLASLSHSMDNFLSIPIHSAFWMAPSRRCLNFPLLVFAKFLQTIIWISTHTLHWNYSVPKLQNLSLYTWFRQKLPWVYSQYTFADILIAVLNVPQTLSNGHNYVGCFGDQLVLDDWIEHEINQIKIQTRLKHQNATDVYWLEKFIML